MGAANKKKHTEARSLHWRKFLKRAAATILLCSNKVLFH
jgi:hypothetical protein